MLNKQTPSTSTDVVVIGAGYAGMIATNRLLGSLTMEERSRVKVTVINPRDEFVERIRLHELAAGSRDSVSLPLSEVLSKKASLLVGKVDLIDPDTNVVRVRRPDGELTEVRFDHLVYAVGSCASAAIPGAREHAFLLGDLEGAQGAADAIRSAVPRPRITVIGGGLTGVEAAAELAEAHPKPGVTLLCAGPLVSTMRPEARRSLLKSLQRLGVRVAEHVAVEAIDDGKVRLADGSVEAFDVCIVAASFDVPDLARVSGLAVDGAGRLRVDEKLRSLEAPNIVGAGDAVAVPESVGRHLRMGCAVALPLGAHAAETVLARMRNQDPNPVSVGFIAQCISLGRKRGYIQFVRADDTPRSLHLGGKLGAAFKESICKMVVKAPKKESVKAGAYSWPKGPKVTSNA